MVPQNTPLGSYLISFTLLRNLGPEAPCLTVLGDAAPETVAPAPLSLIGAS